jgi:transposase
MWRVVSRPRCSPATSASKPVLPSSLPTPARATARYTSASSRAAPVEHVAALLEHTGHYHRSLVQYLQELDLPVYVMPVRQRPKGLLKTDRRDAFILANHLYSQRALAWIIHGAL